MSWMFALLFVLSHVSPSTACPRGSFWDSVTSQCTPCPPGFYQSATNATSCIPCRPGNYHPFTGAQSERVCRNCFSGTFSTAGLSSCIPCPKGTNSSFGASQCVSCPKGSSVYSPFLGQAGCEVCRSGYADEENLAECKRCPPGSAAPPASTSISECITCPSGTYSDGYNSCYECRPGTFSGPASPRCSLCPSGSVSEKDSGSTKCVPCEPGQYGRLSLGYDLMPMCFDCPPNTTTFTPGRRVCRRAHGPCPHGYIETSTGDCERCGTDERYDEQLERCVPCPRGEGSVGGLSRQCAPCAEVLLAGVHNSRCSPWYFYSRPTVVNQTCAPGTYIHDTEFTRFCIPCERGEFSSESNSSECLPCPSGTVSTYYGAPNCESCPEGMVPDVYPVECIHRETGCRANEQLAAGSQGGTHCVSKDCLVHENGSYSCPECLNSSPVFLPNSIHFEGCEPCPDSQVRDIDKVCKCRGGLALNLGMINGTCSECPAGSYGESLIEGADADNVCVQCPAGTYRVVATFGTMLGIRLDSKSPAPLSCEPCPAGFISRHDGATECEQCPPGKFSYGIGDTECLEFGAPTAAVTPNDPLDLEVKRESERFPEWWPVSFSY